MAPSRTPSGVVLAWRGWATPGASGDRGGPSHTRSAVRRGGAPAGGQARPGEAQETGGTRLPSLGILTSGVEVCNTYSTGDGRGEPQALPWDSNIAAQRLQHVFKAKRAREPQPLPRDSNIVLTRNQ